jgi:ABC-2 type transport system ATP-binding protein
VREPFNRAQARERVLSASIREAPASSAPPGPPVLEVRELTKVYRPRRRGSAPLRANDSLDLTVREGEIVALLGPNGAGKSTFLKQLAGQLLPTSGIIRVDGVDMIAEPERAKRRLSVTPQECELQPELTAEEIVRYLGLIKGMTRRTARDEVARILSEVGLSESRSKLIRELSGGTKRRVLIAIAMAGADPRLLLLDEPTTGLDPEARRAVWSAIDRLRRHRRGILLTTHYIEEAEHLADRVVIISGGRFLATGTVEEIRRRATYRGRLEIADVDRLKPEARAFVDELRRRWHVAYRRNGTLVRFQIPDPFSTETVRVLARLTELGARASLAPASLEDAYLGLVGEEPE